VHRAVQHDADQGEGDEEGGGAAGVERFAGGDEETSAWGCE
jgi:hypothetical protein